MATEEKKIKFSGDASGLISEFQKIANEAKRTNESIIGDATKYSGKSGEQFSYAKSQINAIQRGAEIDYSTRKREIEVEYQNSIKRAKTEIDKEKIENTRKSQIESLKTGKYQDETQVSLLKNILETLKDTSKQEIAENKKAVEQNVKEYERAAKRGDLSGYTDEQKMKLAYQSELLKSDKDKDSKQGRGWVDVFKGVLAADIVKQVLGAAKGVMLADTGEQMMSQSMRAIPVIGDATASIYEKHINQQIKQEQARYSFEAYRGTNKLAGLGKNDRYEDEYGYILDPTKAMETAALEPSMNVGGFGVDASTVGAARFWNSPDKKNALKKYVWGKTGSKLVEERNPWEELGYDNAEAYGFAGQISQASGGRYKGGGAYYLAALSQGKFGGDTSMLMGAAQTNRLTKGDMVTEVASIVKTLESNNMIGDKQGNYALVNFMTANNQLINSLSQQKEYINRTDIVKAQLSLNQLGGGFSMNDPRSAQNALSLNGMLTGGNEYMQAMQYGAISNMSPGMSFNKMYRIRKEGMAGANNMDYLNSMIKMMKSGGADKETLATYLSEAGVLGDMPIDTIERLIGTKGDITKASAKEALGDDYDKWFKGGAGRTTQNLKDSAEIANAFAKGAVDGVVKAGEKFAETVSHKIDSLLASEKAKYKSNAVK